MDASKDMLATRTDHTAVYVLAAAERLPFVDGSFDLVTIASAMHWFGLEAIGEVARVLRGGRVARRLRRVVRADMADVPEFGEWARGDGLSSYRPVAKHEYDDRTLAHAGFERAWEAELRREVEMSRDALVEYLMTHSERIAAIREGLETESEQRRVAADGIASFYEDAPTRRSRSRSRSTPSDANRHVRYSTCHRSRRRGAIKAAPKLVDDRVRLRGILDHGVKAHSGMWSSRSTRDRRRCGPRPHRR